LSLCSASPQTLLCPFIIVLTVVLWLQFTEVLCHAGYCSSQKPEILKYIKWLGKAEYYILRKLCNLRGLFHVSVVYNVLYLELRSGSLDKRNLYVETLATWKSKKWIDSIKLNLKWVRYGNMCLLYK
jgi:hypothetical protein